MYEYQIVVFKDSTGEMWYTAQKRRMFLFLRGIWNDLTPMFCSNYERAEELIEEDKNNYSEIRATLLLNFGGHNRHNPVLVSESDTTENMLSKVLNHYVKG